MILSLALLAAQDWIGTDARSRALGNAGVAFAEGPAGIYWNPATLAHAAEFPLDFSTGWGLAIYGAAEASLEGDVPASATRLNDVFEELDLQGAQQAVNAGTHGDQEVRDLLRAVDAVAALNRPGEGVLTRVAAGLELKIGPFGIFGRALATLAGDPLADFSGPFALTSGTLASFFNGITNPGGATLSPAGAALSGQLAAEGLTGDSDGDGVPDSDELALMSQVQLGDAAISSPEYQSALRQAVRSTLANAGSGDVTNTLYFTESGVELLSLIQGETGVAFGLPVIPTVLHAGISLKEVIFESFYRRIRASDSEDDDLDETLRDEFRKNRKRDQEFNIDLGFSFTPTDWLSLGLSVRNLFPMEAKIAGPRRTIEVDPQARLGVAARPLSWLRVGVDFDLLENDSDLLEGYESRFLGLGAEISLWAFRFRGGYMDNVASSKTKGALTAGLGVEIYFFTLDLAGQVGLNENRLSPESIDGQDQAEEFFDRAGGALTIGFNFWW